MDDRLFSLILFGGLALLLGLEMRSPAFREGAFREKARRNWSFLGGAIGSAWVLRLISKELAHHLDPLLLWDHWTLANLVACFLVAELISWFLHWVKHQNARLWRFHFQHHRDGTFNMWLTAHTHALEVLLSGTILTAILILLGFSPLSISSYLLFNALANTYQHSAFDYSLGWLDKIIISPAYHRFHHAVGSSTNFGDTITFWDVVFRTATWPESRRAPDVVIGLDEGPEPHGFLAEMTYFLGTERQAEASET